MDCKYTLQLLYLLISLLNIGKAFRQDGGCLFPTRWEGTWFQSGVRAPIVIEGARLSNKGTCLASEGDKFLVVDDKRVCYRCVVIHEKHANVLQYKETFCHDRESLPTLCRMITGDALLYSMFRSGALPVACPFRGPFTFTYNRGHGECRSPVSSIDVCTEESRLLLSYQACPDVYGTESTVEELECLATWKEGSSRYLVGAVHHVHATSPEDRFRCFVWERSPASPGSSPGLEAGDADYRVAQSGDATCNGLFSATEGSRTMTLRRAPTLNRCRFPHWLASSQHWHTLDYTSSYSFHHRNSTLRIANVTSQTETKVVCAQVRHQGQDGGQSSRQRDEDKEVIVVTHFTMGCQSGYMCMAFHRRDGHVIEVQSGAHTRRPEDACVAPHFNKTAQPYITLVTTSPEPRQCPYMGKFTVTSLSIQPDHEPRTLRKRDWARWRHTMTSDHSGQTHSGLNHFGQNHGGQNHAGQNHGGQNHAGQNHGGQNFGQNHLGHHESYQHFNNNRLSRRKRVDHGMNLCASEGFKTLIIGCSTIDTMEFYSDCPNAELISSYSCHGRWEENGVHYLITTPLSRSSHGARRYCFIYREDRDYNSGPSGSQTTDSNGLMLVHFSSSSHSCDRSIKPGIEGALAFNATSTGKCIETSPSTTPKMSLALLISTVLPTILNYLILQVNR